MNLRLTLQAGALAVAILGCVKAGPEPSVHGAYAFEAKKGAATAAYAVIRNASDSSDTLDSITTTNGRVTSHTQQMVNGNIMMVLLLRPVILQHDSIVFAPGADHLMVEGLTQDLVSGDTLGLTFWFTRTGSRHVTATVRPYGS